MTVILIILVICLWIHLGWIGVCLAIYAEKKRVTAIHEIIKETALAKYEDNKIDAEQELDAFRNIYIEEMENRLRIKIGWTAMFGPMNILAVLTCSSMVIFSSIAKIKSGLKDKYEALNSNITDIYNENKIL